MLASPISLVMLPSIVVASLGIVSLSAHDTCQRFHHFTRFSCLPWTQSQLSSSHAPWSHEPYCVAPTWDRENNADKTFCVYTSTSFQNGRGISLFTTPEGAEAVAKSRAFTDPASWRELELDQSTRPYVMTELPGRGFGLFANRVIATGETILIDQPTLLVHRKAYTHFSEVDQEILQWRALLQLPIEGQTATRALAKFNVGDELIDILQTNGFARSYDEIQHVQLVPAGARINHDCRPNSYYRYDTDTMAHHVWALRDIQPGEEITTSYIRDAEAASHTRRKALKETWGFECTCPVCGGSEQTVKSSDDRLAAIRLLKQRLQVTMGGQSKLNLTKGYEHLIKLYDEEGLILPKIELYEESAYAYGRLGLEDKALHLARTARDWWIWAAGQTSAETLRIEQFIKAPELHPKWRADVELEGAGHGNVS